MSNLTRKLMKVFGTNAGLNQRSEFGALAAGSKTYATDVEAIQANGNWEGGWYSAVLGGNSPAIQDMNAKDFVFAYQLAYILQKGIPQYTATENYYIGSVVADGNRIFTSLIDDNLNYPTSDSSKWEAFNPMSNVGDIIYSSDASGKASRLAPNITTVRKYLSQVGTGSSGAAPQWSDLTPPNVIRITAGSSTYIPTAGSLYFKARIVGGGGGGGNGATGGGNGGTTTFGSIVSCTGGYGGSQSNIGPNNGVHAGGAGGSSTVSSPAIKIVSSQGSGGSSGGSANTFNNVYGPSGSGGSSPFGGGGAGDVTPDAGINTGSGGGGITNGSGGGGGGSGGYAEIMVKKSDYSPSYAYSIGAGGTGGSNAAAGIIVIEEFF